MTRFTLPIYTQLEYAKAVLSKINHLLTTIKSKTEQHPVFLSTKLGLTYFYKHLLSLKNGYLPLLLLSLTIILRFGKARFMMNRYTAEGSYMEDLTNGEMWLFAKGFLLSNMYQLLYAIISVANGFFDAKIINIWNNNLTKYLIDKYIPKSSSNGKFLEISRFPQVIANPEVLIHTTVYTFVTKSIETLLSAINIVAYLCLFIGELWAIQISLNIFSYKLPSPGTWLVPSAEDIPIELNIQTKGAFVWLAVIYQLINIIITQKIGNKLAELNKEHANLSAAYDSTLYAVGTNAEAIAIEKSCSYFNANLHEKINEIFKNKNASTLLSSKMSCIQQLFSSLSDLVILMFLAPLYYAKNIGKADIFKIKGYFTVVTMQISAITGMHKEIIKIYADIKSLFEFEQVLNGQMSTAQKSIQTLEGQTEDDSIVIKNLTISRPDKDRPIVTIPELVLRLGEHTEIKGPSGLGKSVLFKVIAGSWEYGEGTVSGTGTPSIYFLPQQVYIPNGATLRDVLIYPSSENPYTEAQIEDVLEKVGLKEFKDDLNTKDINWAKRLSVGQQQRVAFARAILRKPDWLLMDESTASLDSDNERKFYRLLLDELPGTTLVSIAHRDLREYHTRVINLYEIVARQEESTDLDHGKDSSHTGASHASCSSTQTTDPSRNMGQKFRCSY